jgi:hypothetical protein
MNFPPGIQTMVSGGLQSPPRSSTNVSPGFGPPGEACGAAGGLSATLAVSDGDGDEHPDKHNSNATMQSGRESITCRSSAGSNVP